MKKTFLLTIVALLATCASAQTIHKLGKPASKDGVEIITEQPEGNVVSYTRDITPRSKQAR